jgi:hypothetical protein
MVLSLAEEHTCRQYLVGFHALTGRTHGFESLFFLLEGSTNLKGFLAMVALKIIGGH